MLDESTNRYECRWTEEKAELNAVGCRVHYWVDTKPNEPHWPDSAVMRWDLRPDDWNIIWPELIDHPCALLFAPKHPVRDGPPRFGDWVASWPDGFNWRESLPEYLHGTVLECLGEDAQTSKRELSEQKSDIDGMNIGQRLDKAMRESGFKSQKDLERASGVAQPTINRILKRTGSKGPESETVKKLARACGVSFQWLNEGNTEQQEVRPRKALTADEQKWLALMDDLGQDDIEEFASIVKARQERNRRLITDLKKRKQ